VIGARQDRLALGHLALADLEQALGLVTILRPRAVAVANPPARRGSP
jgi:hypothetical protein